ncbi:MAG: hypothetical protein SPL96_10970 [Bacteroidales bacterium]|nr:hypothetical protein [Bacteroidales bacterium]
MTSAIIAIVGVLIQFAIALYRSQYANRVAKKARDDKLEAIEHEKTAVEVLHLAQELHETTTSDELVNLAIKYHDTLEKVKEIKSFTDKYAK